MWPVLLSYCLNLLCLLHRNGNMFEKMQRTYGAPELEGNVSIEQHSTAFNIWRGKGYNIYFKDYSSTYYILPKTGCYMIIISNLKMRDLVPWPPAANL
jgi:hypothetical protein